MTEDLNTQEQPTADQSVAPAKAELPPRRLGIVAGVTLIVLLADQLSKRLALERLTYATPVQVIGDLHWTLSFNRGVAFSIGSGSGIGPWVSLLAIGVVVAVSLGATSRFGLGAIASGLISGGALGNLVDRAFRGDDGFLNGAVVDFIDLTWWPVFNMADIAIVVGAILLVIASFRVPE